MICFWMKSLCNRKILPIMNELRTFDSAYIFLTYIYIYSQHIYFLIRKLNNNLEKVDYQVIHTLILPK